MKSRKDSFYQKAKKEGFAARSVYKMDELDQKYKLIRTGFHVLDLGSSPGSWLQYLCCQVGDEGLVVGIDQEPLHIHRPKNCIFLQTNLMEIVPNDFRIQFGEFDVVVSDVAPRTTGDHGRDHLQSLRLCQQALAIARKVLRKQGSFVCKMYQGNQSRTFLEALQRMFAMAKTQKPKACRRQSFEIFFVGLGLVSGK